jgi:tripartite-type tricarboxylate transporter receptor subunit TctC
MKKIGLALASAFVLWAGAAAAQDSFAGKQLRMVIGFGPGGGYDLWGRTLARHIVNHLPGNPTMVPENMPGAGSFVAAANIYSVAPKDGTVMGIIARDAPLGPITGAEGARFDPLKLTWIGSPTEETSVCISYKTSAVKTWDDLQQKTLIIGDTGPGTGTYTYPRVLNAMFGTKFKIVGGFPSSSDVFLAMERGEVEGICESVDSVSGKRPNWIKDKTVNLLFQGGSEPNPALKDVPFVLNFAKTDEQKQALTFMYAGQGIGRPFIAPPDMPAARVKLLRDAFDATMKDPAFLEDAKKQKLEVDPVSGEKLAALIQKIYATPKSVVDRISKILDEANK